MHLALLLPCASAFLVRMTFRLVLHIFESQFHTDPFNESLEETAKEENYVWLQSELKAWISMHGTTIWVHIICNTSLTSSITLLTSKIPSMHSMYANGTQYVKIIEKCLISNLKKISIQFSVFFSTAQLSSAMRSKIQQFSVWLNDTQQLSTCHSNAQ